MCVRERISCGPLMRAVHLQQVELHPLAAAVVLVAHLLRASGGSPPSCRGRRRCASARAAGPRRRRCRPSRFENSSNTISRSASRSRCSTTCFAVCAAMRPRVRRGAPLPALRRRAARPASRLRASCEADLGLRVGHFLHDRVLDGTRGGRRSRGRSGRRRCPAISVSFLYAETRAASIAWSTTSFGRFFSAANCVMAIMNSLFTPARPPKRPLARNPGLPGAGPKKSGCHPTPTESVFTFVTISLLIHDYKREGRPAIIVRQG